jgi:hypothetical protein
MNNVMQTQQENLYTLAKQETDAKADAALASNGTLPETSLQEYNQKAVNSIYLSTLAKGSSNFTTTDQAQLYTIAHQCIYQGGRAVYEARSMYALYSDEVYDDIALCNAVGIQARTTKPRDKVESITEQMVKIYPNPTSDNITISTNKINSILNIEIIDVLGRTVQNEKTTNNISTLHLNVSEGVYYIRIHDGDVLVLSQKLVVVKS